MRCGKTINTVEEYIPLNTGHSHGTSNLWDPTMAMYWPCSDHIWSGSEMFKFKTTWFQGHVHWCLFWVLVQTMSWPY